MPRVYDLTDLSAERAACLLERGEVTQGEYHEALVKRYEADLKFSNAVLKDFTTEALRAELAAAEAAKLKARPAGLTSPVVTSPKKAEAGPTPLAAVPFMLSTAFDVKGRATTAGNDALAVNVVVEDAAVVSTLKHAGAVLFGSTNTHELNLGMTTRHHTHGLTKNPFSATGFAGGANGGAAAAVIGRFVPFALALDTIGDARIPAALCGAVGFRPTHDRYSREGVLSLSSTLDAVSIISRTVADAAFLDGVLTSRSSESPAVSTEGLKVAYVRSSACSAPIRGYIDAAIERISTSGVTVVEVDLNEVYSTLPGATGSLTATVDAAVAAIRSFEAIREYAAYASTHNAPLPKKAKTSEEEEEEPEEDGEAVKPVLTSQPLDTLVPFTAVVKACHLPAEEQTPLATVGRASAARYRQALLEERVRIQNTLSAALQSTGALFLVYPTVPTATTHLRGAALDSIEIDGETSPVNAALSINTKFASLAGAPAITIPCALTKPNPLAVPGSVDTERLPVALEFVGAIGSDEKLLAFGKYFQGLQSLLQDPIVVRRWNEAVTI